MKFSDFRKLDFAPVQFFDGLFLQTRYKTPISTIIATGLEVETCLLTLLFTFYNLAQLAFMSISFFNYTFVMFPYTRYEERNICFTSQTRLPRYSIIQLMRTCHYRQNRQTVNLCLRRDKRLSKSSIRVVTASLFQANVHFLLKFLK